MWFAIVYFGEHYVSDALIGMRARRRPSTCVSAGSAAHAAGRPVPAAAGRRLAVRQSLHRCKTSRVPPMAEVTAQRASPQQHSAGTTRRPRRRLRPLPALRRRRLPRPLRVDALRGRDRPAAPLHVDLQGVRRLRAHRRVPQLRLVYMNPRPHHQRVQDAYGAVEDRRYLEEEEGRVATFSDSLAPRAALRARRARCSTSAATSARSSSWPSRRASRSPASSRRAGRAEARGARLGHGAQRRRRGRAGPGRRLRRRHDLGRHRAPARSRLRPARHLARRCGRAASSRSRRWTSTRSSRGSPAGAGRGTCRCTSSTSRAARSPRCCAARASRSPTCARTGASCASRTSSRGSSPTAAPRTAPPPRSRARPGSPSGKVGVNLGDIFTVVARKPLA